MKAIYVVIDKELHAELKVAAAKQQITLRALMLRALHRELELIKKELENVKL